MQALGLLSGVDDGGKRSMLVDSHAAESAFELVRGKGNRGRNSDEKDAGNDDPDDSFPHVHLMRETINRDHNGKANGRNGLGKVR
jgi:hypothetical protein